MNNTTRHGKRRNGMIEDRKGEDMLVDFWTILLFAVVLLLFLILFIATKDNAKTTQLQQRFAGSDLDYMLNSYLKSPSLADGSKTNGEILVEDYLNDDYSRSRKSFELFFLGANKTDNNPVGSYALVIKESGTQMQGFETDPITEGYTKLELTNPRVEFYTSTTIPTRNGKNLELVLQIKYLLVDSRIFK